MAQRKRNNIAYRKDLAFIHHSGFAEFALKSAPGLLAVLRRCGVSNGLVVDLGCGSGLWARALVREGYRVLGVDISESMIAIARRQTPDADFRLGSLFSFDIPTCDAVTSLGECINYTFDEKSGSRSVSRLFRRIYRSLRPGGVFIIDVAEPGQIEPGSSVRSFSEGRDWTVLVEKHEEKEVLTRRIITFRKIASGYRRDEEIHRQRLYKREEVVRLLGEVGFRVRVVDRYGRYALLPARAGFIARKPI